MKLLNGQGFSYTNEIGIFEVETDKELKTFDRLTEAREFYSNLKIEKTIWNVAKLPAELLAYHKPITNKKRKYKLKNK